MYLSHFSILCNFLHLFISSHFFNPIFSLLFHHHFCVHSNRSCVISLKIHGWWAKSWKKSNEHFWDIRFSCGTVIVWEKVWEESGELIRRIREVSGNDKEEVRCSSDARADGTICQTHLSPSLPAATSLIAITTAWWIDLCGVCMCQDWVNTRVTVWYAGWDKGQSASRRFCH